MQIKTFFKIKKGHPQIREAPKVKKELLESLKPYSIQKYKK
jgi:hypothetical protein